MLCQPIQFNSILESTVCLMCWPLNSVILLKPIVETVTRGAHTVSIAFSVLLSGVRTVLSFIMAWIVLNFEEKSTLTIIDPRNKNEYLTFNETKYFKFNIDKYKKLDLISKKSENRFLSFKVEIYVFFIKA